MTNTSFLSSSHRIALGFSLLALLLLPAVCDAASADAKKPAATRSVAADEKDEELVYYRYRLVSSIGMSVIRAMGWGVGAQFAFAPAKGSTWLIGPEAHFALFPAGSIFEAMVGAWHEVRISGAPKLSLSIGALAGAGFASNIPNVATTSLVFMADIDIAQEIDDLVAIRGQFRPGMVGNYFSFMMLLGVSFRFL